jgi:hypothetical protein
MTPTDTALPGLLPAVRALSRADKFRLIQFLSVELAREEGLPWIEAGTTQPLWAPPEALGPSAKLQEELKAREAAQ